MLLAGCASVRPALPPGDESSARQTSWQGRFAVSADDPSNPERRADAANGSFTLTSVAGRSDLELVSPLGQIIARAKVEPGEATLTLSDGKVLRAADADSLTEQSFGWKLPIDRLPDWLNGVAAGAAERDSAGRLLSAVDHQWKLLVTDWNGRAPRKLELNWPADAAIALKQGRRIRVRLVIDA